MDIKITDSLLRHFLQTTATPAEIAEKLSLCGPTVDRFEQIGDDTLYEIEVITNRVDAASAFGIAREANAILPQFGMETQLINNPYQLTVETLGKLPTTKPVKVTIEKPELLARFSCIAISGVTIKDSPDSIQTTLALCGERSLNNVIDISNELTLLYGQPVHVFDLDRIHKQHMIVRESRKGERLQTLDGKTHTLAGGDIIIEDGDGRLIDLCGIMGGELSAVTPETKNILLFVQTYEPKRIRKTSLSTQTRTLAAQLFEKQPDPELVMPVLLEGVKLILERAGGKISSSILDIYPHPRPVKTVSLDLRWLEQFTGIPIAKKQVVDILSRLGFEVKEVNTHTLSCAVPSWRWHDIAIKEDVAEEITRVYGYFRLPSILPVTDIPSPGTDAYLTLEMATRNFMATLGFTEVYNNPLTNEPGDFTLQNPLSEEFTTMRKSLIPSLAQNIRNNKATTPLPLKIFELSNVYLKNKEDNLASEQARLCFGVAGESLRSFIGYLEAIGRYLHVPLNLESSEVSFSQQDNATWITEIDFARVALQANRIHRFQPIPFHTPVIEDLTFTLPPKTEIGPVIKRMQAVHPLVSQVILKDIYQQNYTFTIVYQSTKKTLRSEEVAPVRKAIVTLLAKQGYQLVGAIA